MMYVTAPSGRAADSGLEGRRWAPSKKVFILPYSRGDGATSCRAAGQCNALDAVIVNYLVRVLMREEPVGGQIYRYAGINDYLREGNRTMRDTAGVLDD